MRLGIKQLFTLSLGVVILLSLANCKQFSPNNNDLKLKEVEKLFAALPIHRSFRETWSGSMSKSMLASLGKHYRSDARYEEIREFYVTALVPAGWLLTKERPLKVWSKDYGGRQLTFTKEQYSVVIEYSGEKAIDPDWNYGIDVGWHSGRAW
jgi:hypothetical protein